MEDYKFDDLGWYQFERLAQGLLKAALGLDIESWGGRGDWGRDAWRNQRGQVRHISSHRI